MLNFEMGDAEAPTAMGMVVVDRRDERNGCKQMDGAVETVFDDTQRDDAVEVFFYNIKDLPSFGVNADFATANESFCFRPADALKLELTRRGMVLFAA